MIEPSNKRIKKTVKCVYCSKMINVAKTKEKGDTFVEIKCIYAPEITIMQPPVIFLYAHTDCFNKSI